MMKTPLRFSEGVLVALALTLSGTLCFEVLYSLAGLAISAKLTVSLLLLVYTSYLLARAPQTQGRVTAGLLWGVMLVVLWLGEASFFVLIATQLGALSLLRSLLYHQSPLLALADVGLSTASLVLSASAYLQTSSVALAIWCLFLTQALFVLLPMKARCILVSNQDHVDGFDQALRNAETAVRKLSARM